MTQFGFEKEPLSLLQRGQLKKWLISNIEWSLRSQEVEGLVSYKICEEIIERWHHDIARLQEGKEVSGIHPAKYIGYLAFWLRKLKPVSEAYPKTEIENAKSKQRSIDHNVEIVNINEKVALSILITLLITFCHEGGIPEFSDLQKEDAVRAINIAIKYLLSLASDVGSGEGTLRDAFLYDMRYRTYGPHHVVHLVYNIIAIAKFDM